MIRYVRIFLLYLQTIIEYRSKSFIYFLTALFNPLIMILMWSGSEKIDAVFNLSSIYSYYLLLAVADAVLICRIEEDISTRDIHEGYLSQYLLKPFSYFKIKFFEEL